MQTDLILYKNNSTIAVSRWDTPAPEERTLAGDFINANTTAVTLSHLKHDCIIPVFSKDNESTISHHQFIEAMEYSTAKVFSNQTICAPNIKISHPVKGRIPNAIGKPAKDLEENEKTIYYERMAFTIEIPTIYENVNGNKLVLSVGGVRAYNNENLYTTKSMEKFKIFIGFKNYVCTNLCVSTDGFSSEVKASSIQELQIKIIELIQSYNIQKHLNEMVSFNDYHLTQHQFAQFIGKARMYQFLPKNLKYTIPVLELNDGQISNVARNYYEDENFMAESDGSISLWKMYNLFTGSIKSSYIDSFLERITNANLITLQIQKFLGGESNQNWFLA